MLLALTPATRIFVAVAPVDLRRGFDGLCAQVETLFQEQAQREPPLSREVLEDQDQERPQGERQRRRRHPLPEHLERQTVVLQPESLSPCEHCGAAPERIGEEVSEELEYVPAKLIVQRTVRPKYACRCGCAGVQVALLPPRLLPQSKLGVVLAVYVLLARFDDHIAYYTLETVLRHQRSTLRTPPGVIGLTCTLLTAYF